MSAVNASIPSTSLDAERRAHEPSMEEILASIRRIIADDEALPVVRRDKERSEPRPAVEAPRVAEGAAPPVEPESRAAETLQGHSAVVVPVRLPQAAAPRPSVPPPAPALQPQDFWLRPALRPEPEPEREPAEEEPAPQSNEFEAVGEAKEASESREDILAAEEGSDLGEVEEEAEEPVEAPPAQPLVSAGAAASVASHFQALAESMVINEADVIERYAQDILRPMLKQWLDDNLPVLVERLVRAEIERVARGRRQ